MTLNFRLYLSGEVVTELKVAQGSTVGQLRAKIEEKLDSSKDCPMVGFSKWFRMVKVGDETQYIELNKADSTKSLAEVGIEDRSDLFLEESLVPLGEYTPAIRILLSQIQRLSNQVEALTNELEALKAQKQVPIKEEPPRRGGGGSNMMLLSLIGVLIIFTLVSQNTSQKDGIGRLEERQARSAIQLDDKLEKQNQEITMLKDGIGRLDETLQELATDHLSTASDIAKVKSQLSQINRTINLISISSAITRWVTKAQADALLNEYLGMPLKALWEVLIDVESTPELVMVIVMDKRCGLERRSVVEEGKMLGLNIEKGGLTPLIMAAYAGRVDVMEPLLASGANVNAAEDCWGDTALIAAAAINSPAAIELLVKYGVDVNTRRPDGLTALHVAAYWVCPEAIEMLLAKGADIKIVSKNGETPLKVFEKREHEITEKSQEEKARVRKLLTPK